MKKNPIEGVILTHKEYERLLKNQKPAASKPKATGSKAQSGRSKPKTKPDK